MSECNSIESADLTYYQRRRDVILNRAKDDYENDKVRLKREARDKYRNVSKKRENMGGIDIAICLKKKAKVKIIPKKIIARQKGLNIIMNKIVF